jgi:hypothetical protein
MPAGCPWCAGDYSDDVDPELLCRMHEAEYDGLTLAELDRRDAIEAAEYREWVLGE